MNFKRPTECAAESQRPIFIFQIQPQRSPKIRPVGNRAQHNLATWLSKARGKKVADRPKPEVNYLGGRTVRVTPECPKARVNGNVPFYLVIFNELI